jgi:hypothetical protein
MSLGLAALSCAGAPGVVVHFVDLDRQAVSHPGRYAERRIQRGCGYHNGIPGSRLRVPHSPQQLPVERVNVQAWRCGSPLGLGVEPFMSALGADIDEVHFASNRPVVPLEPGHKSVDDSLLITAHSATLETALKPRQGSAVRGNFDVCVPGLG